MAIDDIKRKMRAVFNYYSSFGDRLNVQNLKSQKFHKIMQDAGVVVYGTDEQNLN